MTHYNDAALCHQTGILGMCGNTCPVFKDGKCEEPQDIPDPDGIYSHANAEGECNECGDTGTVFDTSRNPQ